MNKREFQRRARRAVKSFVSDEDYENTMDDLAIQCSDAQWQEVLRLIEIARRSLEVKNDE